MQNNVFYYVPNTFPYMPMMYFDHNNLLYYNPFHLSIFWFNYLPLTFVSCSPHLNFTNKRKQEICIFVGLAYFI